MPRLSRGRAALIGAQLASGLRAGRRKPRANWRDRRGGKVRTPPNEMVSAPRRDGSRHASRGRRSAISEFLARGLPYTRGAPVIYRAAGVGVSAGAARLYHNGLSRRGDVAGRPAAAARCSCFLGRIAGIKFTPIDCLVSDRVNYALVR